ncbi:hypothetical protein DFH11DRAFT_413982 [Phellopilus nigrolimitatus]|nr:hypothetical protein DFH11DRAFT_413982 [Phellopilus nigrolimitatus]
MVTEHNHTSFPEDILRLIVEECLLSSQPNAFRFFLVSSYTKAWAEPHIYSKVVLRTPKQITSFISALNGESPTSLPAQHVRVIWLLCADSSENGGLRDVPEKCPNLIHFAYDGPDAPFEVPYAEATNAAESPRLSRLTICSPKQVAVQQGHMPIPFQHLTHLHFICPSSGAYDELVFKRVGQLTSLSYLLIEITSPSAMYWPNSSAPIFPSHTAQISLYNQRQSLRDLFSRIPTLRSVIVKSDFPVMGRSRMIRSVFEGEPRIILKLRETIESDEAYLEGSPSYVLPEDQVTAWHDRLLCSLEEADEMWSREDTI